eukprot:2253-Prymnesium_polylepis.2
MPGDPLFAGMRDRMSGAGGGESDQEPYRVSSGAFRSTGLRAPRDYIQLYPGALRCGTILRVP